MIFGLGKFFRMLVRLLVAACYNVTNRFSFVITSSYLRSIRTPVYRIWSTDTMHESIVSQTESVTAVPVKPVFAYIELYVGHA